MIRREDVQDASFDDIAPGPALPPLTPGEVLLEEFMRPVGPDSTRPGDELGVPATVSRPSSMVRGRSRLRRHCC